MNKNSKGFKSIGELVKKYKPDDTDKYISKEFQKYGYELAKELGELKRVSFFIKLAKEKPRSSLERARSFVKDAQNVKSMGKLFIWKLSQIEKEKKEKKK